MESNTAPSEFHTSIFDALKKKFGSQICGYSEFRGDCWITIDRSILQSVLAYLKDSEFEMNFLTDVIGVDMLGRKEPRFEVVYNLYSMVSFNRVFIKVEVDEGQTIPTGTAVHPGANFPEREIFDMYGITFEGHPDMTRILMPDDWVGHPLRKDFPLGGEEVEFTQDTLGPSLAEEQQPYPGSSFFGPTGSSERE